ncbi:hypothetical protein MSG28_002942 [Choristoneura fumiferana]|uniref:Uncharacterized protein n=1 Tax=Choristoneura fumiferana TaxID=7141 RepID=A0ACC0JK50_CHOFU|nr:hypothetical protein MSG28_002942 [Choristoneura fumiferana]
MEPLSGALRDGGDNEVSYGTQLNGDSQRVPLRTGERNMFVLPRAVNDGDSITVSGTFNNPERFTVNLLTGYTSPDYNNIACQLEANFPSPSNSTNGIILRMIDNGQTEVINGTYMNHDVASLMTGSTFEITFKFETGNRGDTLSIFVKNSILEEFILKHQFDQISFLELRGDANVNGLAFQFA